MFCKRNQFGKTENENSLLFISFGEIVWSGSDTEHNDTSHLGSEYKQPRLGLSRATVFLRKKDKPKFMITPS